MLKFPIEQIYSLKNLINSVSNITIVAHKNPDGDAVGSSLALYHYLKKKEKNVQVILPDEFPSFLNWMQGSDKVLFFDTQQEKAKINLTETDLIFVLDFNDLNRIGDDFKTAIEETNASIVMIDHHQNPKDFAKYSFSVPACCSTAQLIYEFIEAMDDLNLLDITIAEGIYTGLVTDTASFRFDSVEPKTHRIVAHLLEIGLKNDYVHQNIYDVNSIERLKLLGYILNEKLEIIPKRKTAIISITNKELMRFNPKKGDTEGFVNYALSIQGMEVGIFVREKKDEVRISFRSKGKVQVNEFANKYFNGGGHKNAAGGTSNISVEETVNRIKELLPELVVDVH